MKVFHTIESIDPLNKKKAVFTLGNFDGVHLAHQKILKKVVTVAQKQKLSSVVLTFDNHPLSFFRPQNKMMPIQNNAEKLNCLANIGIDFVYVLKFDEKVARLSANEFLAVLRDKIEISYVVAGYDFAFGKGGLGNAKLFREKGFFVEEHQAMYLDNQLVSSTLIRKLLTEGHVDVAEKFLGRAFSKTGKVVHGLKKGREIGFPTLNIEEDCPTINLKEGVYVVLVNIKGLIYKGICNIGYSPTFSVQKKRIEVHLLDLQQELYGSNVQVFFKKFLRDEIKFLRLEDLVSQIKSDINIAKIFFEKVK